MISYQEALSLIRAHSLSLPIAKRSCVDALHLRLAQDIVSPIDLPPFDNAAMDGYALKCASLVDRKVLPLAQCIRAHSQDHYVLPPHMAAMIMTGAPMPIEADAVVIKEDTRAQDEKIFIKARVSVHENIRFKGEDIRKGALVAKTGCRVTPQLIGVLHGVGQDSVQVYKPPKIAVISTGDELVHAGQPLRFGQVYYLVGPMLKAQCLALGFDASYRVVKDDEGLIVQAINEMADVDIILVTGGMSKGDYDLVRPALKKAGIEEIFYQGWWRPGKPLYFGRGKKAHVFGLPGNPVAAFVGFHMFVRMLILDSMKAQDAMKPKIAIVAQDYSKKPGYTFFARAYVDKNNKLTILPTQGSHQIFSLSRANALAVIPPEKGIVKADELIHYFSI